MICVCGHSSVECGTAGFSDIYYLFNTYVWGLSLPSREDWRRSRPPPQHCCHSRRRAVRVRRLPPDSALGETPYAPPLRGGSSGERTHAAGLSGEAAVSSSESRAPPRTAPAAAAPVAAVLLPGARCGAWKGAWKGASGSVLQRGHERSPWRCETSSQRSMHLARARVGVGGARGGGGGWRRTRSIYAVYTQCEDVAARQQPVY